MSKRAIATALALTTAAGGVTAAALKNGEGGPERVVTAEAPASSTPRQEAQPNNISWPRDEKIGNTAVTGAVNTATSTTSTELPAPVAVQTSPHTPASTPNTVPRVEFRHTPYIENENELLTRNHAVLLFEELKKGAPIYRGCARGTWEIYDEKDPEKRIIASLENPLTFQIDSTTVTDNFEESYHLVSYRKNRAPVIVDLREWGSRYTPPHNDTVQSPARSCNVSYISNPETGEWRLEGVFDPYQQGDHPVENVAVVNERIKGIMP